MDCNGQKVQQMKEKCTSSAIMFLEYMSLPKLHIYSCQRLQARSNRAVDQPQALKTAVRKVVDDQDGKHQHYCTPRVVRSSFERPLDGAVRVVQE